MRFQVVDEVLVSMLDQLGVDSYWSACFLIADLKYWMTNEADIKRWLVDSGIEYKLSGMILTLRGPDTKSAFLLRWG